MVPGLGRNIPADDGASRALVVPHTHTPRAGWFWFDLKSGTGNDIPLEVALWRGAHWGASWNEEAFPEIAVGVAFSPRPSACPGSLWNTPENT